MIDLKTLKEIGKLKGLNNIGYAEKDYLQEILLLIIYRNFDFLVFKGGTCLYKIYKLNRFSEDLDFSATKEFRLSIFLKTIKGGLERFNIGINKISFQKARNTILIKIRVEGASYTGSKMSLCTVRIDINTKSEVLDCLALSLTSLYPDIPSFELLVMSEKEMLAEKVRAIMTRAKARDIYDLWFLLTKNTKVDFSLIKQKLGYYKKEFSLNEFKERLELGKEAWEIELRPLIQKIPPFLKVKRAIIEKFKKKEMRSLLKHAVFSLQK